MRVTRLTCTDFRCLREIDFRPQPTTNVIHGDNAQGKTSLLEAILFLTTSRSHRTAQESDLVAHGEEGFRLRAWVQRHDREVVLEANSWRGAKRFKVDGVAQTRISDILGKVNVVFFSPEDVSLIRGTASHRRRFLDMEISQLQPTYLRALQRYRQILRQRNELLRTDSADPSLLDSWDEQLAQDGGILMSERDAFVRRLAAAAASAHGSIAQGETLAIEYQPNVRQEVPLLKAVADARASDLRYGTTTRGPHRDDLALSIAGKASRHFSSQGQQRTAALALKLAELELIRDHAGETPVLMLDDVLSELDEKRAGRLFAAVPQDAQCLVTATVPHKGVDSFGEHATYFRIQGGRLEQE